jgi:PAS domain S-box-containing protein
LARDAFRQSNKRLEAIAKPSRTALVLYNESGKILHVNAALEALSGYSKHELIGRSLARLFPEAVSPSGALTRRFSVGGAKDSDFSHALYVRRKDGIKLEIELHLAPIKTTTGPAVLALVTDSTRHRKIEKALHESEERLRLALFNTNIAIWDWDVKSNRLTWSSTNENILGNGQQTVHRYEAFAERIHPDDLEQFESARDKAIRNHEPFNMQLRLRRLSGEIRWVSAIGRPYYDKNGQAVRVLGTIRDVTDRQRASEAMRESEARFRNIFEHAATGIAITDMEGRFQQCNPAYCALVGYSQQALRHMQKADIIHPDDRAANLREIQRLKDGAVRSFEIENRYLGRDGRVVWVRKYVSSLPDTTSKGAHLVILVTDITVRRQAEEELRRNETELRLRKEQLQDLTAKLFSAQDEERRRIARELHDDFSQRIGALVLDIATIEKLPADTPDMISRALGPVRIQLEQLADDLHGLAYKLHPSLLNHAGLKPAIEEHIHKVGQNNGLRIVFKVHDAPDTIPHEISMCLFRILQESLHNIVKHANATEVLIRLSGTTKGIGLSVMDNGTGFDPADKTGHHRGLGLLSMEERVRYLDGFLRIHSRPADGTKVCAWIPSRQS